MIELLLEAERALEMGRVDAAAAMYRQVADADPRNAIAVVGLARVALERGDEAGALELARRALTIDPENAAAGRMVTRLEEVITYRGETVPAAAPDPDTAGEREPAPAPEPEPVVEPAAGPEPVVEPAAATPPEVEPEPVPRPAEPARVRRRSWLDRLLRRNR